METTRRGFLAGAAAASVPFLLPSRLWAAETPPAERITLGFVGMGKQNRGLLGNLLRHPTQVLAVCDVDTTRREAAQRAVNTYYTERTGRAWTDCAAYRDFRELLARDDIDAVCIATPDHWHALVTLAALRAGKDVYCEKPLTHNIQEAVAVMEAVRAAGRVLQTGSMQRSSPEFRVACELVRNGAIGAVDRVVCSFGDPGRPCDLPAEAPEPGLDWDLWLGPAPVRPYHSILSPRGVYDDYPDWRAYWEYGGGKVTDFGAHHLDIAQWGLGMDDSGPVEVLPAEEGTRARRGVTLVYAGGVRVLHHDGFGIHFHGNEGEVLVNRGRFVFIREGREVARFAGPHDRGSLEGAVARAEREYLREAAVRLYRSRSHTEDFLQCVKERRRPNTHEGVGARSAICCHLMNLAYRHGERMAWDPAACAFAGGTGDPAWLTRDYRTPWDVA